ncbi:MAG: hypothetical protein F6J93_17040 [Oscillatoria sp. SIO1A7]|nr:hypothetical protein [Oscillatoria sp. SIO1A7]
MGLFSIFDDNWVSFPIQQPETPSRQDILSIEDCNSIVKFSYTPTPHTLHPTPHTLHPTPYTPHPTPYTPHPTPQV